MVALTSANACCVVYGDSSEIISLLEHDPNNIFIIDTKYYTVSVKIFLSDFVSSSPDTNLPFNAVIINGTLDEAKLIDQSEPFVDSDVRIFVSKTEPTKEMFDWSIQHMVEIIDLAAEPERILEAMGSSIWPGATMKSDQSNHLLRNDAPQREPANDNLGIGELEDDLVDLLEAGDDRLEMAQMFNLISSVRNTGTNMSDEDRRQNAERVMSAISKMLGDDLDLDS